MAYSTERYFEDYVPGMVEEFGGIIVDEAEIVDFAKRFGPQEFHTDPVAAARGPFGGLIARGWHSWPLMMRMFADHYLSKASSRWSARIQAPRRPSPVRPWQPVRGPVCVLC